MDAFWPLRGLAFFLARPSLWLRPLAASALAWLLLLAVAGGLAWWRWPGPEQAGWTWWLAMGKALAVAIGAALVLWVVAAPFLMALAMESLARAVFAARGVAVRELGVMDAVLATGRVAINTVPQRLGWPLAAVLAAFAGPLGGLVGALGAAHVAAIDAHDTAWALAGRSGLERLGRLRAERAAVRGGAAVAALLLLLLASTLVGAVLWLPAVACGAALRIADQAGSGATGSATGGGRSGDGAMKAAERG